MRRAMKKALMSVASVALVGVVASRTIHAADETRHWYWLDVYGIPDCYVQCNPNTEYCQTNPDCTCDCWQ